jgi:hypothetical protein
MYDKRKEEFKKFQFFIRLKARDKDENEQEWGRRGYIYCIYYSETGRKLCSL